MSEQERDVPGGRAFLSAPQEPSSSSPPFSSSSPPACLLKKHYYVAVGSTAMKLLTLTNLLSALATQEPNLVAVLVCNSRDTLDEVVSALSKSEDYDCCFLHSDMHSGWRRRVLDNFNSNNENTGSGMKILLSSHVCLPREEELKRSVRLLINYDIPMKKEHHLRRVSSCIGANNNGRRAISINFLAANEVSMLKSLEAYASQRIEEMPMILSEIFQFPGN